MKSKDRKTCNPPPLNGFLYKFTDKRIGQVHDFNKINLIRIFVKICKFCIQHASKNACWGFSAFLTNLQQ